jgi:hypothetical protein
MAICMGHLCLSMGYSFRFMGQDRVRETLETECFVKQLFPEFIIYRSIVFCCCGNARSHIKLAKEEPEPYVLYR